MFSRTVSGTVTTCPASRVAVLRSTLRRGGAGGGATASPAGTAVGVDACSLSMTAGVQSYSARTSLAGESASWHYAGAMAHVRRLPVLSVFSGLKAGDWVEVKSKEEILATLDHNGAL